MRINANNRLLPGVQTEQVDTTGDELTRKNVYLRDELVGQIVYRRRPLNPPDPISGRGSMYGWQPADAPKQSNLTSQTDAILTMIGANK